VERESSTDIFFSLWWNEPVHLKEAEGCAEQFGITSFKMYMYGVPGSVPSVDDAFLLAGFRQAASLGNRALAAVHAENAAMVEQGDRALREREKTAREKMTLADWSDRHPDEAEEEAVLRAVELSAQAGCRLYIVHLSTGLACGRLRELRKKAPHVTVETTSPYLSIDKFHPAGFLAKMTPPFRAPGDREVLWEGIREGVIDTIGTDSAARSLDQKNPAGGLFGSKGAFPAVETHFPVLLTEGYHRRGIPLHVLAEKASLGPARAYGLFPRKGTFFPGADADLVLVDLNKSWKVRTRDLHSAAGFSLYEGRTLKGKPVMTIKGGMVAFEKENVLAEPGTGSYLRRSL
jgi:dihydropyrimidinase